ncbi:MAG: hypothetical protein RIC55_07685, partial [Pirellulaceae bacterium]
RHERLEHLPIEVGDSITKRFINKHGELPPYSHSTGPGNTLMAIQQPPQRLAVKRVDRNGCLRLKLQASMNVRIAVAEVVRLLSGQSRDHEFGCLKFRPGGGLGIVVNGKSAGALRQEISTPPEQRVLRGRVALRVDRLAD